MRILKKIGKQLVDGMHFDWFVRRVSFRGLLNVLISRVGLNLRVLWFLQGEMPVSAVHSNDSVMNIAEIHNHLTAA
ncbi:MAG: hypothetical protein ACOYKN_16055 [Pirellula sp.]